MSSTKKFDSDFCTIGIRLWSRALIWSIMLLVFSPHGPAVAQNETTVRLFSPLRIADTETEPPEMGLSLPLRANAYSGMSKYCKLVLTNFPLKEDELVELYLERFYITTASSLHEGKGLVKVLVSLQ